MASKSGGTSRGTAVAASRSLALLLVVTLTFPGAVATAAPAAAAKPQKKQSEADRWDAAKESYKAAQAKLEDGNYAEALPLFREADDDVPGSAPKYGIALTLDRLGRMRESALAYQKFLDSNPDPARFEEKIQDAKQRLDTIKQRTFVVAVVGVSLMLASMLNSSALDVPLSMVPENDAAYSGAIGSLLRGTITAPAAGTAASAAPEAGYQPSPVVVPAATPFVPSSPAPLSATPFAAPPSAPKFAPPPTPVPVAEEEPPPPPPPAPAPAPAAAPAPAPVEVKPAPVATKPVTPEVKPAPAPIPAPAPAAPPTTVAATPAVAAPVAPPPVAKKPKGRSAVEGVIHIVTNPVGAKISVDGVESGDGPLDLDLPEGRYIISASMRGYKMASAILEVQAGKEMDRLFELRPKVAPAPPVAKPSAPPPEAEAPEKKALPAGTKTSKDAKAAPKKPAKKPPVKAPDEKAPVPKPDSTPSP